MPDIYYQNRYATLYHGDCREVMDFMEPDSVDLTVTSPPYDDLRSYEDSCEWNFNVFREVASGLWKVTRPGGVIVWVVGDATIDGTETGTSFRQALHFKEIGFNLYDTMIYHKLNPIPNNNRRYTQSFEYMFVLCKGIPKAFNPIVEKSKNAGRIYKSGDNLYDRNQCKKPVKVKNPVHEDKIRENIFEYGVGGGNHGHPAVFPDRLAMDHISSWSDEGDIVFDPFCGSGTTGVACMRLNRKCMLCEKVDRYCGIASRRLEGSCDLFNMYEE